MAAVPNRIHPVAAAGDRFAARMLEKQPARIAAKDDREATLLYFSTGGGKSESFFGLLVFCLAFDRLRGKQRGITALVRYPLRLLTSQQAQRLSQVLGGSL